jgi:hypothetical protein
MLATVAACDPDIWLGARSGNDVPDVSFDVGSSSDAATSDATVSDGRAMPDADASADIGVLPDIGVIPDTVVGPDIGVISDAAGIDRVPDATPTILWTADHESGDLSAWRMGGGADGGGDYQASGQTEVLRERAHGGSGYAAKLTIDTSDGADHTARLYRRTANGGAYYSAWFFFSQAHTPIEWWSIFLFRAQRDPNDIESFVNLWNLNVERPDGGGNLTLSFYDHLTGQYTRPATPTPLPVGQWTHLEAYFNYAPPSSTRITVWQDGQLLLDLTGLGQSPSSYLYWSIGTGSNGLLPRVSTIYIDDAAIATGRLGPGGGG